MSKLIIRPIYEEDQSSWFDMVQDYNEDCIPFAKDNWHKIIHPLSNIKCKIVTLEDYPVGFMCYLMHDFVLNSKRCYLADLYVKPEFRRQGIARTMLVHLLELMKNKCDVYWVTENINENARKLYDQYAVQEYIRYDVACNQLDKNKN